MPSPYLKVTEGGLLISEERFLETVGSPQEAFEIIQEMYGMIEHLARAVKEGDEQLWQKTFAVENIIEDARREYKEPKGRVRNG